MSETTKIVVFGAGQFSQTLTYYLDQADDLDVVAFCVDRAYLPDDPTCLGRPILPWEDLEEHFPPGDIKLLGPVSFRECNIFRRDRYLEGKQRGYDFHTFIHPSSSVHTEQVGENCIILEANIVQPYSTVGNNVILWSFNHIGHHTVVQDHCFFAGMVGISGNTAIGERCFFGGRSTVRDNVNIGEGCIIGMGASVIDDLADESVILPPQGRIVPGVARKFARRLL